MITNPDDLLNQKPEWGQHPDKAHSVYLRSGLTKREYFAAIAMQGLIAGCYSGNNIGFTPYGNCVAAVEYANALINELNKETK